MIAYITTPFCFASITDIPRYLRTFEFQHVHAIHFGAFPSEMTVSPGNKACASFLRTNKLRALRKVKITLMLYGWTSDKEVAAVARVKAMVEAHLPDKDIEVCSGSFPGHIAYWEKP